MPRNMMELVGEVAKDRTLIKAIHVEGRRWFDSINGNTYHTAKIWVDGKEIGVAPFQYGYDSQYLESAHEVLHEQGFLPMESYGNGVPKTLRTTCEDLGIELDYEVTDGRKRDLHTAE